MKKRVFIILFASLLLLCACQPTPESSIIVGKDQQQMIEKAQEEASYASSDASAQTVDWAARLGAPEHYTTTLKSVGGRLTVEVDADVYLPSAELPIVHLVPRSFSDEDAKRIVTALWGEDPQCIEWTGKNRTKAMCNRLISIWKDALDHWEDYGCLVWDNYDTKEDLEEALQQLILEAASAPDTLETFSPTYEWEPVVWQTAAGQKTYGDEHLMMNALNPDGTRSMLSIYNGADVKRSSVFYLRDAEGPVYFWGQDASVWPNELSITEDEARTIAENKLQEMGFDHLICVLAKPTRFYWGDFVQKDNPYQPCWKLVFTPAVNGTAITYTYRTEVENTDYNRFWNYERCYIVVDEQGVAALTYEDICTPDEITVQACSLLPFEKIIEIFEKMVLIVDNNADALNRDSTYRITSIRLGMVSIPEQNGEGGYMVPCWDFMGDPFSPDDFPDFWRQMGWTQDGSHSFLTINAIDGSIIQRG